LAIGIAANAGIAWYASHATELALNKSLFLSLILENIVVAKCDMNIIVQAVVVL